MEPNIFSRFLKLNLADETSVGNIFERNPYVLERILDFLDVSSLKQCRLVSQLWDKEALRIISESVYIPINLYYFASWNRDPELFQISVPQYMQSPNCEVPNAINSETGIANLLHCLDNSKKPEMIFKTLRLIGNVEEWPQNLEILFQKYGKYLEYCELNLPISSLSMQSEKPVHLELLTSWCPNLKHYEFETETENPAKFVSVTEYNLQDPLNLESITMNGDRISVLFSKWIYNVLSRARNLKTLIMPEFDRAETVRFYKRLNDLPLLVQNLLQFECNVVEKVDSDYSDFVNLMKGLKRLTSITLRSEFSGPDFPSRQCFTGIRMNLQHLKCCDIFYLNEESQNLLNCVDWFPNLESFTCRTRKPINPKQRISQRFEALENPHLKLKKLSTCEIIDRTSLDAIIMSFPNLQYIYLELVADPHDWLNRENRLKLKDCLEMLGQLKSLTELVVFTVKENYNEIAQGLAAITNCKKLQYLTIGILKSDFALPVHFNCLNPFDQAALQMDDMTLPQLASSLAQARDLKNIHLIKFKWENKDSVLLFAKTFFIPLAIDEIDLEFGSDEEDEDFDD